MYMLHARSLILVKLTVVNCVWLVYNNSKWLRPLLTIFGHKIALGFIKFLGTNWNLESVKESQQLGLKFINRLESVHDY